MTSLLRMISVFILLTLSLVAGECDVYDGQSSIERCRKIQECVNTALFSNKNNLYVLDKVFRSTQSKAPLALFVNYHVTIINDGSDSSGSGEKDRNNETTVPEVYKEQLGWTSSGIYGAISPMFLVSLTPFLFNGLIGILIDDNFNPPKLISMELRLISATEFECDLPENTTQSEVKEALKHLTMSLNYNTTGKTAYIWNTDPSSFTTSEIFLLVIVVLSAFVSLTLLTVNILAVIPNIDDSYYSTTLQGGLLFIILPVFNFMSECGLKPNYLSQHHEYSWQYSLSPIIQFSAIIISFIFGLPLLWCFGKNVPMNRRIVLAISFSLYHSLTTSVAAYLWPIFIVSIIFPVEILSIPGMLGISLVGVYTVNRGFLEVKPKYHSKLIEGIKMLCLLFLIVTFILGILMYFTVLGHIFESPTSHLFHLLLAVTPTILAILGGSLLKKKLESSLTKKGKNNWSDGDNETNQRESQQNQQAKFTTKQLQATKQTSKRATKQANGRGDQDNVINENHKESQGKQAESETTRSDTQSARQSDANGASQEIVVAMEVHEP